MEVHRCVEGHVAVQEGLPQEGDEVAAHGEQDVGKHEGDAGSRAPRQDDAHAGGVRDTHIVCGKRVVCTEGGPLGWYRSHSWAVTHGRPAPWGVLSLTADPAPGAVLHLT